MPFRLQVLVLFISIINVQSARILAVFPMPSVSHQIVFRPITQELVKRGHDVTVITPYPAFAKGQAPVNLTEIDVQDVSLKFWNSFMAFKSTGKKSDLTKQLYVLMDKITKVFELQLRSETVSSFIKSERNGTGFDVLILEAVVRPTLVYAHLFDAPVIAISSLGAVPGLYEVMGTPEHPILYPSLTQQKLRDLTMMDKIFEIAKQLYLYKFSRDNEVIQSAMLRGIFGNQLPRLCDLYEKVQMALINVNPIWEGSRPVPPNVIHMGGIHQKPTKQLPNDLKDYLDNSQNGTIYISFGTNVSPSMLPAEKISAMIKVFSRLPYDILWKYDKDELPEKSENIQIAKWLPQADLLQHPKIKLFITQCGLQSTDEAITAAVPLIAIPMYADQYFNAERSEQFGIGIRVDMDTLSESSLQSAIEKVLGDNSYRTNMELLRLRMTDQPQTPLERAIWWIEYVIRHKGAKHLRSPAANISWSEYLELPLVFTLLSVVVVGISICLTILYISLKLVLIYSSASSNIKEKVQ